MQLPLQLSEIRAQLGGAKAQAERLTADLTEGQLWQRPPDGGWSVGECLAHLNVTGEGYLFKLGPALKGAADRRGQGPFRLGLLGVALVRASSPDAKAKLKTPRTLLPERRGDVLTRFLTLQDALLALTHRADGLDLGRIKISSPVSRFLRLSAFEALNAVTVHELRHLQQAARVREALGGAPRP